MRAAIVSDIHGNRHAFEAVLSAAREAAVDEVWCLGDLVGYGADPDACVDLARDSAAICLAGNHDLAVTGEISMAEFSSGAGTAARWTQGVISEECLRFLLELEPEGVEGEVGLYHASPRDPVWEYVLSLLLADRCLDEAPHPVSLIGHSHVALAFHRPDGGRTDGNLMPGGSEIRLEGERWLLNPGSVGQPRDGDPRAAWLELDLAERRAVWHREDYDIAGAQAAILAAGLPDSLAERLGYGQ